MRNNFVQHPCSQNECTAAAAADTTVPVYNLSHQEVGQYTLPGTIFGVPVRKDILHRVVRWQLAKRQQVCSHSLILPLSGSHPVIPLRCAANKGPCHVDRELTKLRLELKSQVVEGNLGHRKGRERPELVPSELDRLTTVTPSVLLTSRS